MIVTRTPLRVSLLGGGTDMESFYASHPGAVISAAIDKALYICINPKFDGHFRVSYSRTENAEHVEEIQHDIVREVLKLFGLKGVEVVSISDIPGEGSGLGSSSAFTVGLLRAVCKYCGYSSHPKALAEHAYAVEHKTCGHPCGKQDAYAAACGSLQFYEFMPNRVRVEDFRFSADDLNVLNSYLMLFWTGLRAGGGSDAILRDQTVKLQAGHSAEEAGILLVELTRQMKSQMQERQFEKIGKFVHASWVLKKRFATGISNDWIDELIGTAHRAGASGAKISGAGGGGFLLVVAAPTAHNSIETALGLRRIPFRIGVGGSQVVYQES